MQIRTSEKQQLGCNSHKSHVCFRLHLQNAIVFASVQTYQYILPTTYGSTSDPWNLWYQEIIKILFVHHTRYSISLSIFDFKDLEECQEINEFDSHGAMM